MRKSTWTPARGKITTGISVTRAGQDHTYQQELIAEWALSVPKLLIVGPVKLNKANGLRILNVNESTPIRNIISAYMFQIPGNEVVSFISPDVYVNADQTKLFDFIEKQRLGLAWACHADIDGLPRLFAMSASVSAHIMTAIPQEMSLCGNDWVNWMHKWLDKSMMAPRYIDATGMGIIENAKPLPVLDAYSLVGPEKPANEPEAPKEEVVSVKPKKAKKNGKS